MSPTKVVISPRPIKTSERIDKEGNIINPQTKQIIQAKEPDYIPPVIQAQPAQVQPVPPPIIQPAVQSIAQIDPMAIQAQIAQVEENLKKLKELKKLKVKEMKETIKLLELGDK